MTDAHLADPPSAFIEEWVATLAREHKGGRALDVAMGRGRHAVVLARQGYRVFGVDIQCEVVLDAVRRAAREGFVVRGWCADLTTIALPVRRFDLIVVTRYLQRDFCQALTNALLPGGTLLFETFTEAQRDRGRGPTSPDHLLKPGELPTLFPELDALFYEERTGRAEDAVARLAARKRSSPS